MGGWISLGDIPKEELQTSKHIESTPTFDTEIKKEIRSDDILHELQNNRCSKSTHHSRFISLSNLTIDSLPENMRTNNMFNFVKRISSAVVRICVNGMSESRQHDCKFSYPPPKCSKFRRYGSGWACLPFERGETSIRIVTARHLVYDEWEAENTEVTFFYDGPNESQTVVATGKTLYIDTDDRDFVVLECDTIDKQLKKRLTDALLQIRNGMLTCDSFLDRTDNEKETALIISHPHGGSKHLSFGSCVNFEEFDTEFDMATGDKSVSKCVYKYDTATCPGSSGAPVIILGKPGVSYFWTPHCSTGIDGCGVSAKGLVIWRSPDRDDINIHHDSSEPKSYKCISN